MAALPLWFEYLIVVLLVILFALSIANAVYYGRARHDSSPNPPISEHTANTMMWINIILAIASFAGLIILIVRLIWFRDDSHLYEYRDNSKKIRQKKRQLAAGEKCDEFIRDEDKEICASNLRHLVAKSQKGIDCDNIRDLRGSGDQLTTQCYAKRSQKEK
jgi:hypothetical protein